jgi:hypothetical protein
MHTVATFPGLEPSSIVKLICQGTDFEVTFNFDALPTH